MSSDYFMNQALKNMAPILSESNRMELVGTITAVLWVFAGIFPDPILYLAAMVVSIVISIYLVFYSSTAPSYHYNLHVAAFRRLLFGAWAHWAYTGGKNTGPDELVIESTTIPVVLLSQWILVGLAVIWFATKYYDQLQDPNIEQRLYPFLLVRGLLRGYLLFGLIWALFSSDVPYAYPFLLLAYLIEPYVYGMSQILNPTMSHFELSLGNARLPSVALRESFLSNTFFLIFTMLWGGVSGNLWSLLRVYYIIGSIMVFIYSMDAIKKFKDKPLGGNSIADFLENTPDILQTLDLESQVGHVINSSEMIELGKKSGLNLEPGSIVIPLEEKKGKVNALILGKAESILDVGKERIGENIDGVSTALIPAKEFQKISSKYVAHALTQVDFESMNLPSLDQLQGYVSLLAKNMGGFVEKLVNQINSIDLSNYGIIEEAGKTQVILPGIQVNETPDLTSVKVGGLRVLDGQEATTVRWGNTLTVVDLPKATFVSLPGLTVIEVAGQGTAVNIMGFRISDGLPADKLDEFRTAILQQMDRWEAGIDAELGRYLADKSASGLLSIGWDGEFNLLLDSKNKTMGTHQALELGRGEAGMKYLPPDFDEKANETTKSDVKFIELTGMNPNTGKKQKKLSESEEMPKLDSAKSENTEETQENQETEFTMIHDVVLEDDDD